MCKLHHKLRNGLNIPRWSLPYPCDSNDSSEISERSDSTKNSDKKPLKIYIFLIWEKTQMWTRSKTQIVRRHKNIIFDNTQYLKLWQQPKSQIMITVTVLKLVTKKTKKKRKEKKLL